jgi:cbb3-type cytochrome oxidase subunit 1
VQYARLGRDEKAGARSLRAKQPTTNPTKEQRMSLSKRYLILGAIFGVTAMIMGIVMGAKENFSLAPVHAHLNLVGWVALTLYGVVYKIYPEMTQGKLAGIQFWCASLGVIFLVVPLTFLLLGNHKIIPILAVGELLTLATLAMFLVNLWRHRST